MNNFRCYNRCTVKLLLTGLLLTSCSAFNVTDLVDIVLAVKLHFRSVCVCVAHDQADGKSSQPLVLFCYFIIYHISYLGLYVWQLSKRKNFSHTRKLEFQPYLTQIKLELLYSFFWVIPRRLYFMCRRCGTPCSIFIVSVDNNTTYEDWTECSGKSAHKIQTLGTHIKERI